MNAFDRLTWFLEVLPILIGVQPARVFARSLLSHWAIRSLGMPAVAVSKLLGISQAATTRAAYRGEAIAAANSLELVKRKIA